MKRALLTIGGLVLMLSPVFAHHDGPLYDLKKEIVLSGTIVEWTLRNPHSYFKFSVDSSRGPEIWTVEGGPPRRLTEAGLGASTIKAGEKATLTIFASPDGSKNGVLLELQRADGSRVVLVPKEQAPRNTAR